MRNKSRSLISRISGLNVWHLRTSTRNEISLRNNLRGLNPAFPDALRFCCVINREVSYLTFSGEECEVGTGHIRPHKSRSFILRILVQMCDICALLHEMRFCCVIFTSLNTASSGPLRFLCVINQLVAAALNWEAPGIVFRAEW